MRDEGSGNRLTIMRRRATPLKMKDFAVITRLVQYHALDIRQDDLATIHRDEMSGSDI